MLCCVRGATMLCCVRGATVMLCAGRGDVVNEAEGRM